MSRAVPKYRKHPNGQAFVQHQTIPTPAHRKYLGVYGSAESKAQYAEFLAQLRAGSGRLISQVSTSADDPVEVVAAAFVLWSTEHKPPKEADHYRRAVKVALRLFGTTPAGEFGPAALKQCRAEFCRLGHCRAVANRYTGRLRFMFRWAAENELIPGEVSARLGVVAPLRKGAPGTFEAPPVVAVAWADVEPALAWFSPAIAGAVTCQFFGGMRPAEVVAMRPMDVDQTGDVWLYRPAGHKNAWRGQSLVKAIPPALQGVLAPFLDRGPEEFCFSPLDTMAWARRQLAARKPRKTKVWPSELKSKAARKRSTPARRVGRQYTTASYWRAINGGFRKAAAVGAELVRWKPLQLRHGVATLVSQEIGQQAAQRWLGHADLNTTAIYTESQTAELVAIARRLDPVLARLAAGQS
jgi:integrase